MSTRLEGHVPRWATASRDRGAVPSGAELNLTFVLSRSAEMQAQFARLLADQQNPSSPRYHQWLTAQEAGEQYGPTQHDLDALTEWLRSQGLTVKEVAPSGVFVQVSGAAATVAAALNTEFHSFERDGGLRMSTTMEPSIPSALAPIVASISGLADAGIRPTYRGEAQPASALSGVKDARPQAVLVDGSRYLSPGDFAAIYDVKPVYSTGFNGAGEKVAVIGRSRIAVSDITAFESTTGLTTNVPNVVVPTSGVDPGTTGDGDQLEATLDVERVVGVAPGAQVDLVVSASTSSDDGIWIAAQYEVQTLQDPVMNISFGGCEAYGGASGVAQWDTLFSQAASEGISVLVSSGDSGAAGCDTSFALAPATQFLSINNICSSAFATCLGGTEFVDTTNLGQYWSSASGANVTSALGYIPEGGWNESNIYDSSLEGFPVVASGGGASVYVAKPSWQTGAGVPADHARDVPDISFPSASHDAFYSCFAAGGGDCAANYFYAAAGTSNAAPSMAGVAALLNQKTGGRQGNLNPLLYRIAASTPNAFHDATPASSGVSNCSVKTLSLCNNSTPSSTSGSVGLAGYALTTGYDQVTGLGSLDVANFLAAASSMAHTGVASTALALHGSAAKISDTQTATFTATVSSSASGTPTGTVQFYANGSALGSPVTVSSGTATTAALTFPSAGTYYVTAAYSGDSNFAASTSPGFELVVTGLTSSTQITLSNTLIPVGTTASLSVSLAGVPGSPVPTGTVQFLVLGSNYGAYVATVQLVNGSATASAIPFSTVGSFTVTANYLGDAVYSPSSSTALPFYVNKLSPVVNMFSFAQSVGTGGETSYEVTVSRGTGSGLTSSAPSPTGTFQLYVGGVAQGGPTSLATEPVVTFPNAGTFAVTAVYSGDGNWLPSTSNVVSQTVLSQPATFQMTQSTSTLSLNAGATSNIDVVNVLSSLGFTGKVNLACSVAYNGAGTANSPPTCSLSPASATLTLSEVGFESAVTISGTAPPSSTTASYRGLFLHHGWSDGEAIGLCVVALWLAPVRRRNWRSLMGVLIVFFGLTVLSGCGGGGSGGSSNGPPPGTTPGSYTVTITPTTTTSGAAAPAPLTIALTIN